MNKNLKNILKHIENLFIFKNKIKLCRDGVKRKGVLKSIFLYKFNNFNKPKSRCRLHLEKSNTRNKAAHKRYINKNNCRQCGLPSYINIKCCFSCKEKHKKRTIKKKEKDESMLEDFEKKYFF